MEVTMRHPWIGVLTCTYQLHWHHLKPLSLPTCSAQPGHYIHVEQPFGILEGGYGLFPLSSEPAPWVYSRYADAETHQQSRASSVMAHTVSTKLLTNHSQPKIALFQNRPVK
mgnify:CR=1 FL=1